MCTTYTLPVVQSVFLPSWFPTGNHMHYIPHYTWDPHDHHACLPCIPLFKAGLQTSSSLASLCFPITRPLLTQYSDETLRS